MTKEEIKEENMQRAVEAGILCFVEEGIANTQIQSVIEKAHICKRSFLRYFGNKDRFVIAVLKSINERCLNSGKTHFQKVAEQHSAARERLRALFEVTGDYFLAHPEVFLILSEGQAYLNHSPEKGTFLSQYTLLRDYWPTAILSLMKQGLEDGSITCFSKDYIQKDESNAIWYAFVGLLVQLAYSNALGNCSRKDCAETIRRFVEQTIQSLN